MNRLVRTLFIPFWAAYVAAGCTTTYSKSSLDSMMVGRWEPSWESHFRGSIEPEPASFEPRACYKKVLFFPEDRPSNTDSGVPMIQIVIERCRTDKTQVTHIKKIKPKPIGELE